MATDSGTESLECSVLYVLAEATDALEFNLDSSAYSTTGAKVLIVPCLLGSLMELAGLSLDPLSMTGGVVVIPVMLLLKEDPISSPEIGHESLSPLVVKAERHPAKAAPHPAKAEPHCAKTEPHSAMTEPHSAKTEPHF